MKAARFCVLALCAAIGVSGYLSPRGTATDESQPPKATPAKSATSQPGTGLGPKRALNALARDTARQPTLEPAAPDLKAPSQTPNHVFDALNADIGPEGEYVDPNTLAEVLRSDPVLARLLSE
jgi:hypothetical protein